MHRGYIKLWRKVFDNPLWLAEKFTKGQAWIDLIALCNHKPGAVWIRGKRVEVQRGQTACSERFLAARWHWSRGKVRRFFFDLKTVQQVVQQKNNVTSLITLINYDTYQANSTTDDTTDGPQTDHKRYRNKNDKNDKKGGGAKLPPRDFEISKKLWEWAEGKNCTDLLPNAVERCFNWARSKGVRRKDWDATIRNWLLKDLDKIKKHPLDVYPELDAHLVQLWEDGEFD